MKLSHVIKQLNQHPSAGLAFTLPDGSVVAQHFHVTEVGRVRKDFIDCGGTTRQSDACVLQIWVAKDVEHRLEADKLAKIIELGKDILVKEDLPVEIEYDVGVITQFVVESLEASNEMITFKLASKHTACLAPDQCGVDDASADRGCCSPSNHGSSVSLGMIQDKCC